MLRRRVSLKVELRVSGVINLANSYIELYTQTSTKLENERFSVVVVVVNKTQYGKSLMTLLSVFINKAI